MRRFLLVGLTGGIATGKSTVTAMLANPSVRVVDADALAREVVEPGTPAHRQIVAAFGPDVLQPDGRLDRARLAEIVFPDPVKRKRLEAITHPAIRARFEAIMADLERAGWDGILIWDAALLVESGGNKKMDRMVVVTTDPATQLRRLVARDGCTAEAARTRTASQMPLAVKARYRGARARGVPRPPRRPAPAPPGPPVSPRRNARAAAPRAPVYRSAARGRTRALGQHFLRDRTVVDRILELVRPTGRDLVVEIGPGRGALTETLAARAGRLLALEIDAALSAALQERFAGAGSVEIRQADARLFDYAYGRGLPIPPGACSSWATCPTAWASRSWPRWSRAARRSTRWR